MTWDGPQFAELINNIRKHVQIELHEHHTLRGDKSTESSQDKSIEQHKDKNTEPLKDKNAEFPQDKNVKLLKDKNKELSNDKTTESPNYKTTELSQNKSTVSYKDKITELSHDKSTVSSKDKITELSSQNKSTVSCKDKITELSQDKSTVSSKLKNTQTSNSKITKPLTEKAVPLSLQSKESRSSTTSSQELKTNVSHVQTAIISQNSRRLPVPQLVTPDAMKFQARKQQSPITEKSPQSDGFVKKQTLTKLSSVAKFSAGITPPSKLALDKTTKGEHLKLSVVSKRLLKPIQSDPSKNSPPTSKIEMTSKSPVRQVSQPKVSSRPIRLPPLQHSKSPVSQPTPVKEKASNTPRSSVAQTKKASS